MTRDKKISDIISNPTAPRLRIKDYAMVDDIFRAYLNERYFYMAKEIFYYGTFDFFRDFYVYLNQHFKTDTYKKFFIWDMFDMYTEYEDEVENLKEIKWRKKQYKL